MAICKKAHCAVMLIDPSKNKDQRLWAHESSLKISTLLNLLKALLIMNTSDKSATLKIMCRLCKSLDYMILRTMKPEVCAIKKMPLIQIILLGRSAISLKWMGRMVDRIIWPGRYLLKYHVVSILSSN